MHWHTLSIMTLLQLPCHIRYLSVTSQLLMRYLSKTCVEKLTVFAYFGTNAERITNFVYVTHQFGSVTRMGQSLNITTCAFHIESLKLVGCNKY